MPNWCSNYISVRGTNQAEIKRLADAFDAGELCNAVIPVPEILKDTTSPVQQGEEEIAEARRKACGYTDWYSFQTSRWGTKWDISVQSECDRDEDGLGFNGRFDSAWSPPMGVVEQMTENGLEVTLYYHEPGMCYVGKYEDGCDDYYEYSGENSSTVVAAIGNELDDFWGISESMAEYEAENEEEELTAWLRESTKDLDPAKTIKECLERNK